MAIGFPRSWVNNGLTANGWQKAERTSRRPLGCVVVYTSSTFLTVALAKRGTCGAAVEKDWFFAARERRKKDQVPEQQRAPGSLTFPLNYCSGRDRLFCLFPICCLLTAVRIYYGQNKSVNFLCRLAATFTYWGFPCALAPAFAFVLAFCHKA